MVMVLVELPSATMLSGVAVMVDVVADAAPELMEVVAVTFWAPPALVN